MNKFHPQSNKCMKSRPKMMKEESDTKDNTMVTIETQSPYDQGITLTPKTPIPVGANIKAKAPLVTSNPKYAE
ncbi:hypothetical protein BOTNAR_1041g00010 [Botryotinia narcissicola]|uniref:Uncharacterized protein n=1 Tax=Botryotinia narcissicola TaxID=278944 RepID=A0A4Z1H4B1_9HELO|nr:hypothetical protein BOTNAR_1041g00010 [Botryotinia narcissicola]